MQDGSTNPLCGQGRGGTIEPLISGLWDRLNCFVAVTLQRTSHITMMTSSEPQKARQSFTRLIIILNALSYPFF